jgi:hypothetical protein
MYQKLLSLLLVACPLAAQVKLDEPAYARIKSEEAEHSQVMHTLHVLTDRYGPRLTGSPNFEAAANWVVKQMTEWGFKNAHLEPWDFGHPGWLNKRAEGYMVTPIHGDLTFRVLSWTPSTKGTVSASSVEVEIPHGPAAPVSEEAAAGRGAALAGPRYLQPTRAEFDAGIAPLRAKVKGKIVLVGKAAVVPVNFNPPALRRGEGNAFGGRGGRGGRGTPPAPDPSRMTGAQVTEAFDQFLVSAGALVRINDAGMDHGLIRAFQNRTYDVSKAVPTVVMRNDDYGRIERLLGDNEDVKLEFNIANETYPKGVTSYDVVGEIPGTDKADEIVMLGGHLDSWHSATGATDNAIGSTMMLEAARLIQALGLKPRRTIRVGLWSGEEEGLLGSAAYVKAHFGTFESPKPEYAKLDCYFNIDSGTGRVRGASVFGPSEGASLITAALEPFKEWSGGAATATNSRATGGTDSTNFNAAGLPGIGLQQDPIEYQSFTWHTQLDTYERIVPEDVKQAATEIASMLWTVANLDQMLPRFPKDQMPAPANTTR